MPCRCPELGWWAGRSRPGGLTNRGPDSRLHPSEPAPLLSRHARALLEQVIAEMAQMRDRPAPGRPVRLFRQTLRMDAAQTAAARMNVAVRGAVQRPLRRCGQGSRRALASAQNPPRRYIIRRPRADQRWSPRHAEIDQLTQHVAALEFCVALVDLIQLDVAGDQVVELKMSFLPSVQKLRHIDAEPVATH